MDREINFNSIRALDKQIEEYEKAIIRLKRTRNSLLNVSTLLPPEILGSIFRWNVIPNGTFDGLLKGSYNFLLVCHHWFEVASRAPGLWCFWGNSIQDWARRHVRCGTGPLDLVLEVGANHELDDELRSALQDRATQDTIRRIHLSGYKAGRLLNSVISSIVAEGEETRLNSIESFIVWNMGWNHTVDVSDFFSRYHLPKLRCLRLYRCGISSWDLLESRITALTTLELSGNTPSPIPTLSQLLSILSFNPLLQDLKLSYSSTPHVVDGESSFPPVPLRHLEKLRFSNGFHHVFSLLNRLELPDRMDSIELSLHNCSPSDILQTIRPYLGDRVRRRGKFPGGGLALWADRNPDGFHIRVGDACKCDDPDGAVQFIIVDAFMDWTPGKEEAERIGFGLITCIPRDEVGRLWTNLPILRSEELCIEMCHLTCIRLVEVDLSMFFAEPEDRGPHASKDLLRSLDSIWMTRPILSGGDWSPLTNFLSHRATIGNQISLLNFRGRPHMDEDVVESIKRAVEVFEDDGTDESESSDEGDSDEDSDEDD